MSTPEFGTRFRPKAIRRGSDRPRYDDRYILNNVTSPAAYATPTTLSAPGCKAVRLDVFNNAIYYQLGKGYPNPTWVQEVYLAPARAYLEREFDAIRIRSAVAGSPAQVTIEALSEVAA